MTPHGKGRKNRITPLIRHTVAALKVWLAERAGHPDDALFRSRRGTLLSRDALERRIALYGARPAATCPTLTGKHVIAHVLRHTAAMRLLEAGVDTSVIALWLGHEHVDTTQIYLHANLALKERSLAPRPRNGKPGRYRAPDTILAFLDTL